MKREIKFRAWDLEDEQMSYPIFLGDETANFEKYGKELNPGDDLVVMQSTGLLDKNGKEVFEGDIVKYMYLNTNPIEERKSEVKLMAIGDVNRKIEAYYPFCYSIAGSYKEERREITECFLTPADECEIIGNIYENPELLNHPNN